jgi:hypothetical protein
LKPEDHTGIHEQMSWIVNYRKDLKTERDLPKGERIGTESLKGLLEGPHQSTYSTNHYLSKGKQHQTPNL